MACAPAVDCISFADADIVIASEEAWFVDPHVTQRPGERTRADLARSPDGSQQCIAISPCSAGPGAWTRTEALRLGLVDEVVPAASCWTVPWWSPNRLRAQSPAAVEATKRAARSSLELPFSEAMQMGWDLVMAQRTHPDALEGPAAFVEKRDAAMDTDTRQADGGQ